MLISKVIYETTTFSPAIPTLPQCKESHRENSLDGQNLFIRDSHESLVRASTFIKYLEKNLDAPKGSKSPLQALLKRSLHLPTTEENKLLFSEITQAFFKQKGYLSRLFSNESWEEWLENHTPLGKVASQFRNCIESSAPVSGFTKEMNPQLIQKANEESSVLLKGLDSCEVTRTSKDSCIYGLTRGIAASFLFKNPLPLLLELSECFPGASAQYKIGNEFQVNTYTSGTQSMPSVASFDNGNFVVTWQSGWQDGSDTGVYGQLFDRYGNKTGSEFRVNTYTTNHQNAPSVTSFNNGNFVATWSSRGQDGDGIGIYGQLFDEIGSKIGNEFRANSYTTNDQQSSSLASFSNGNFFVTWTSYGQDGSGDGIYSQLFDRYGNKTGSEFRTNTYTTDDQNGASVTSFNNGNFVVTWMSMYQDGSQHGIFGQLFNENATKIGNEFQINSYTTNDQTSSSIANLENDNFVVTWQSRDQDGSDYGVYSQLFDGNGSKIGSEFRANSFTNGHQVGPSVASFSNGNFVVTWQSLLQDGSEWGVYGQLFDGNGSTIGNEFPINSYTSSSQGNPSVASLPNGNFVVTWSSNNQDGDGAGVFGQLFNDLLINSSTATSTTFSPSTTSTTTSPSSTSLTTPISSTTFTTSTATIRTSSSSFSSPISSTNFTTPTTSTTSTASSTHLTTPNTSSTLASPASTTNPNTSSSKRSRSILWIGVGVGGLLCFCVTPIGLLLLKRRKSQPEARSFEESGISSTKFELEPIVQRGHKIIGKTYLQLSTLVREEAEEIYMQTGHLTPFPETQKKFVYVIGSGQFGKIKVAQRIEDKQYVASKKVKGEENMRASEEEAQMQQAAGGENILPIYNTIRLEDALYHFMPLAGLGDGSTIQRRLALLNHSPLALTVLQFIAQNILTGLQTIHAKGIYHLDIKPDNLVFTKDGTAYITDFGCAKRLKDLTKEAIGDNRYFSPERLSACNEGTFDAEKADMWAAGVTLLQIFYNKGPLELLNMPQRLLARVEKCDQAHFDKQLQQFSEVEKGSILWVIKGLLDTNPKKRFTAEKALQATCFHGLDKIQQEEVFEDLRREAFAQHGGMEKRKVNLSNYRQVMEVVPEETALFYNSASNQQFYGYGLTPDF